VRQYFRDGNVKGEARSGTGKKGAWSSRPCGRKAWLFIDELAMATERNGTCQPEPREWRRKRIEDGPKGAESRVASKAKDVPPG